MRCPAEHPPPIGRGKLGIPTSDRSRAAWWYRSRFYTNARRYFCATLDAMRPRERQYRFPDLKAIFFSHMRLNLRHLPQYPVLGYCLQGDTYRGLDKMNVHSI